MPEYVKGVMSTTSTSCRQADWREVEQQLYSIIKSDKNAISLISRMLGDLASTSIHVHDCMSKSINLLLTNSKAGFLRKFSGLRHSILHYASVATFITFFHTLNPDYISISSTEVTVIVHIVPILLPLKCNAASCDFNLEGCFCSSGY